MDRTRFFVGSVAVLFTQGAVLLTYRRLPDDDGALFFANEWRFALNTALSAADVRATVLLCALCLLIGLFIAISRRGPTPPRAQLLVIPAAVAAVIITVRVRLSPNVPLTPDLNALHFASKVASWGGTPPPFFAIVERRPTALAPQPPLPFNILWIVHEAFGATYEKSPDGHEVTPSLLALSKDPNVVWFERMHTVSSCTDVSVPSILSGVSSAANLASQTSALLPFELAWAAGAKTFADSSQALSWAYQDRYLGRKNFDHFRDSEAFDPSAEGDVGVPDELAFQGALEDMKAAASEGKAFVGLLRTNGTHGPYRIDSDAPWTADPGFGIGTTGGFIRYLNALHRLDREFGKFWSAFAQEPYFDNTLVILTADHGEAFSQHGLLWHCGTFYPEESHVPGLLRIPSAWMHMHPQELSALRARATQTAFVTGLAPTLAAMASWEVAASQFDDRALWEAPRREPVMFTNCSDFRRCADPDFGLYEGGRRWVYSGAERRWRAFDEETDPGAQRDVAADHRESIQSALDALKSNPRTSAITRRMLGE